MKKIFKKGFSFVLSLLVLLCMPNGAAAWEEEPYEIAPTTTAVSDDLEQVQNWEEFQYTVSDMEVTIVGYTGTILGTLEIPSEIDGLPVARVEDDTFFEQDGLTEVVIPASVIEIGSTAFHNCENLRVFTVAEDNPAYCVRNGLLLDKSESILIRCPSGRYGEVNDIPDTVFLISDAAFSDCSSLSRIQLPDSVISIGSMAFSNCTALYEMILSENLEKIGDGAFLNCTAIQRMILPERLRRIGMMAFSGCQSMSEVIIPASVQSLPDSVFLNCIAMQRVVLSEGLISISTSTFKNCTALQEIQFPNTLQTIRSNAFENCSSLQRIHIPASMLDLSANAFSGCISLSEVTVAAESPYYTMVDGVLMTADQKTLVFYPPSMSQVHYTVPETVETIESYAFQDSIQLQFLTIPATVKTVEPYACYDADSIKEVVLNGAPVIQKYAFQSCDQLETVTFGEAVREVQIGAFLDCPSLKEIVFPKTITRIEDYAFGYLTDSAEAGTYTMVHDFVIYFYQKTAGAIYAALNGFNSAPLDIITTTTTAASGNETTTSEKITTTTSKEIVTTTAVVTTGVTTTRQHGGVFTSTTAATQTTAVTTTTAIIEIKGDLNLDGRISTVDVIQILKYYTKIAAGQEAYLYSEDPVLEEAAKKRVDIDEDGVVTVSDAVMILEIYAKQAAGWEK